MGYKIIKNPRVLALNSDGNSPTLLKLATLSHSLLYTSKNATFDRQRGNDEITVMASAARTASAQSADQTNYNHRGVLVALKVTVNPGGAETLIIAVTFKEPIGGAYRVMAVSAALFGAGGTGEYRILMYPGVAAASQEIDQTVGYPLPRTWRVEITNSSTGSWTYSVSAMPIL